MSDSYFQVTLLNVPQVSEDPLTEFCFSHGAGGMAEELKFSQTQECWEGQTVESEYIDITVYFEDRPSEEFFLQLTVRFPDISYDLKEEENKDWLEEWKKGYEPFLLSPGFWIVPSWREAPPEADLYLKIDPQMAFGTGTHHTTQLAAEMLSKYLMQTDPLSLLDVGTGTGILAMMAKKLGCQKVVGIELDEVARLVARENCSRNNLTEIDILDDQVGDLSGSYDWVLANIIDGVLVKLQVDLMRLCSGHLLLTGILDEREEQFMCDFLYKEEFQVVHRAEKGGWIGLLLVRNL